MITKVLLPEDENCIGKAAAVIKSGGLLAIPTETVYGLGADALNADAVKRIFEVKGRQQDNPLIIHVASAQDIEKYCKEIPDTAYRLADRFWPGPLTIILKKRENIPDVVSAGLKTVAVRCPESEITREIIKAACVPIAAPSANISGKPSPTTAKHVLSDLGEKIEAVVDGGRCRVGLESTIIDLTVSPPRLLRPGGITPEEIKAVIGEIEIDPAVLRAVDGGIPKAPGMKYRHYAPKAKLVIVRGETKKAAEYINSHTAERTAVLCFSGEEKYFISPVVIAYGHERNDKELGENLFASLRDLDRDDIDIIYARCPEGEGVSLAVKNRLQKAADYNVVDV